jgi:hypothetical protein
MVKRMISLHDRRTSNSLYEEENAADNINTDSEDSNYTATIAGKTVEIPPP